MAQHDLVIANASGATVRADLNDALAALGSTMKGPNAPPSPLAGMLWIEDDNPSATRWTLRVYDGATFIAIGVIDATTNIFEPSSTAVGLSLVRAVDAAAARAAIASPASPSASGVGEWRSAVSAAGGAFTLPAGGTWAFHILLFNVSAGTFAIGNQVTGVLAGGTVVGAATAGFLWTGFCWRVA